MFYSIIIEQKRKTRKKEKQEKNYAFAQKRKENLMDLTNSFLENPVLEFEYGNIWEGRRLKIEGTAARFMRYADCGSETHHERAFCEYMEQELNAMGITYERQILDSQVVTDGWNILAKVPGQRNKKPLLFVLHLDTVAPGNQVKSYVKDGKIYSVGNSVFGADGKLAIALIMEALAELKEEKEAFRPVELLFTVCQELGSHGAKFADYSHVESEEALIPDHYITGEVLLCTPSKHLIHAELIGQGAHVIRKNEPGVNALATAVEILHQIPMGQVEKNLRINVFDLVSLSPSNAVPGHARFDMEIRTFGNGKWEHVLENITRIMEDTAKRTGCRCNIRTECDFPESDFSVNEDMLRRLEQIYTNVGISMKRVRSFGVMDATCTQQIGIRSIPIGLSVYHSHSVGEYVVIEEMEKMLQLMKQILKEF